MTPRGGASRGARRGEEVDAAAVRACPSLTPIAAPRLPRAPHLAHLTQRRAAPQAEPVAGGVLSPLRSAGSGGRRRAGAAPAGGRRPPEDASGDDDDDELEDFDPSPFMDAVIKGACACVASLGKALTRRPVFASHAEPNFSLPWQRKRQMASTSSGFIIEGAWRSRLSR